MTLLELYKGLFGTFDHTYGNTSYYDADEIIFFKDIMGGNSLNSDKNNSYLQVILCEKLYKALCGNTEWDIQLNARRSSVTKGEHHAKNSLSPKKLIDEFVRKDPSVLLSDELRRIEDAIDNTAKITCCGLTEKSVGRFALPYVVGERRGIADKYKAKLMKELSEAFNSNCSEISDRLMLGCANEENIAVYITCAIFMAIFDNKYYDPVYLSSTDKQVIENKIRNFAETFISENNDEYAKKTSAVIKNAPEFAMPTYFCERREELEYLLGHAFSLPSYRVHAVIGERGLGKTTMAYYYANEATKLGKFSQVFYPSYRDSIKVTIANLKNGDDDRAGIDERFKNNLSYLAREQKRAGVLLIIDNYDNPKYKEELAFDNREYLDLIETGCSILITTTSDVRKCHAVEDHVTYLSRLDTDDLVGLFYDVKGRRDDDDEIVRILIDDYLLRNTYLVVLCAELAAQGMSAREIIEAISSLHADEIGNIATSKDGKRYDERTLLEHFCCVLDNNKIVNPDDVRERAEMHGVLGILSLIPIGGMRTREFNEVAYPYKKRKIFTRIISRLKNHNLVFENGGMIYIQPVVKEYIAREILLFGEDTYAYLRALTKKLDVNSFDAAMMHWVKIAEAAYRIIGDEQTAECAVERTADLDAEFDGSYMGDEVMGGATILLSAIVRCYSSVNMYEKAYEYGTVAYSGLNDICCGRTQPFDSLTLAACFSIVAHAFLHGDPNCHEKNMKKALECIKKCDELAKIAAKNEKDANEARMVLSRLDGEIAAYYIKNKEYEKALERHMRSLRERELMIESDPENEHYRSMLAFSYRGIGTDYYYLSFMSDRERNMRLSYENHLRSVEIFKELYGSLRLETVTSANRLIGAAIGMMSDADEELKNELAASAYGYLSDAFEFYSLGDPSANREMADSIKKVTQLYGIMGKSDAATEFNMKVIEAVKAIETADDRCKSELATLCTLMAAV